VGHKLSSTTGRLQAIGSAREQSKFARVDLQRLNAALHDMVVIEFDANVLLEHDSSPDHVAAT